MHLLLLISLFPVLLTSAASVPKKKSPKGDFTPGKLHALLVAGSNGVENYRHQADVAHAYHLLIQKGVPAGNIVVMMYDDVASDPMNPTPGQLRNAPNGPDYYAGLKIDYRKGDVNVDNFVAVLTGNAKGVMGRNNNGRVLQTTTDDNIFLFYANHGAPGFVAMPTGPVLTKGTLQSAIKKARFSQLSVYIEACEAGSMLAGMENDPKVFGLTAATASEPSWACNCAGGTCYGDEFSVQWITDSEKHNLNSLNLTGQYSDVARAVRRSTVCRFGNSFLYPIPVSHFQGETGGIQLAIDYNLRGDDHLVPARDVPLYYYRTLAEMASEEGERQAALKQIESILQKRKLVDSLLDKMVSRLGGLLPKSNDQRDGDCMEELVTHFEEHCHPLGRSPYLAGRLSVFLQLARERDCPSLVQEMGRMCQEANFAGDKQMTFL